MKRLTLENRHHRKHPARKVGTVEWCREVKRVALRQTIATLEKTKMTPADAVQAMKVRKSLLAMCPRDTRATWEDPKHWCDLQE